MTREQKLALIVGFALFLGVGILISDHFSASQRLAAGDEEVEQIAGMADTAPETGFGRAFALQTPQTTPAPRPAPQQQAPSTQRVPDTALADAGFVPVESRHADARPSRFGGTINDAVTNFLENPPPAAASIDVPNVIEMAPPPRLEPDPREAALIDARRDMIRHDVHPNETLWGIAEKYYGDGGMYKVLAEVNAGRVGADGTVRKGVTLYIPTRAQLAELTSGAARVAPSPAPARQQERPAAQPESKRTYVVKKGDVLGVIAQRLLGSSKRMSEILEINKDKIDDPDDIWVGLELRIPAR